MDKSNRKLKILYKCIKDTTTTTTNNNNDNDNNNNNNEQL